MKFVREIWRWFYRENPKSVIVVQVTWSQLLQLDWILTFPTKKPNKPKQTKTKNPVVSEDLHIPAKKNHSKELCRLPPSLASLRACCCQKATPCCPSSSSSSHSPSISLCRAAARHAKGPQSEREGKTRGETASRSQKKRAGWNSDFSNASPRRWPTLHVIQTTTDWPARENRKRENKQRTFFLPPFRKINRPSQRSWFSACV